MHEALSGILFPSTNYSVKANRMASYLLMFLSEIDGRETRRVICHLTYLFAGFVINSLQRDYAIYENQVERVTNYLLTSPSKPFGFSFLIHLSHCSEII